MTPDRWILILLLAASWQAGGQTTVDLSRQGKLGTGTVLPAQCTVGQVFFKSDAPSGANVFACTAANVWAAMGISSAGPGIVVSGSTVAMEDALVPMYYTGAGAPGIGCTAGRDYYVDTAAGSLYFCKSSGQWQATAVAGSTTTAEIHLPVAGCAGAATPVLKWDTPPSGTTAAAAAGCGGSHVNQGYAAFASTGSPALDSGYLLPPALTGTADVYVTYATATSEGTFTLALDAVCTALDGTGSSDPEWTANNFFHPGQQTAPSTANAPGIVGATGLAWPAGCAAGREAHFRLIRTDSSGTAETVNVKHVLVVVRKAL